MKAQDFSQKLSKFTDASLKWCSTEAENSTQRVGEAITALLGDTARVSESSAASLDALNSVQTLLQNSVDTSTLKKSLETLSKEHGEIDSFIQPIVESLQFQDRLRQNLENLVKMINVWLAARSQFAGAMNDEGVRAFGELLMKQTVMKRERDIIRSRIEGLPAEVEADSVTFF